MGTLITTPSTATEYQARFACSMVLWERARHLINHDVRRIVPFPLYMDRAQGCRKWDVEGTSTMRSASSRGRSAG
jgi:4-aminobutyrate aminotransferase-like enzyme